MRLLGIFIWIAIGAVILWFFTLNLNQYVTIYLFTRVFENVNLVTVIFISFFIGVIFGAILFSSSLLKAKSNAASLRKQNKKIQKELDNLRNLSMPEPSEPGPSLPDPETEPPTV